MSTNNNSTNKKNKSSWVDVVWYLCDITYFNYETLSKYLVNFGKITIASVDMRPENLPLHVHWYRYNKDEARVTVWNELLSSGANKWKLYLIDDEILRVFELDATIEDNANEWPATLIHHRGSKKNKPK